MDVNRLPPEHLSPTAETEKVVELRMKNDTAFKIPRVCYQTWLTKNVSLLSQRTQLTIHSNKMKNPDINFILMDDSDIADFIRTEFPRDVYNAYLALNPQLGPGKRMKKSNQVEFTTKYSAF